MRAFIAALALIAPIVPARAEPLRIVNGRLFIDARVNGVASEGLLDSGAEMTLVDPKLAARANLPEGTPQTLRGSGGETQARLVEGATVEALGIPMHPEAVVVSDLAELSRRLIRHPTELVVGRELFDSARLRIDIAAGEITVAATNSRPEGKRLPLSGHAGIEAVPVEVNGTRAQAEFDLGNGSDVLVSRAMANRLKLKPVGTKQGGGIGGARQRQLVRLRTLDVAGRRFRNLVAAIDEQPNANDLNVGTSILRHFLIVTDFADRSVWLSPVGTRR